MNGDIRRSDAGISSRIAALVAGAATPLVNWTMPAITGSLARDLGLSSGLLGVFASADSVGCAGGALLAIAVMHYWSPRRTVLAGLGLLVIADMWSTAVSSGPALAALRAVGGTGTGLAGGACSYVYGLDPERNTAAALLSASGMSALVITAMPVAVARFGWRATFICLIIPIVPALILSRFFPRSYGHNRASEERPSPAPPARRLSMLTGLCAIILYVVSSTSFWPYVGGIGAAAGLSQRAIATALSISAVWVFGGSALVVALGERLTGRVAITLAIVADVVAVGFVRAPAAWAFTAAVSAFDVSSVIFAPALFGLLVRRAPAERFAVHLQGAGAAAAAFGPILGGLLVEQYGFGALQVLNIVSMIVTGALLWIYSSVSDPGHYQRTRRTSTCVPRNS